MENTASRLIAYIIVIACIHYSDASSQGGNNSVITSRSACTRSKSNSLRLKRDLLCDYDSSVRPVLHHSQQTAVYIALFPICLTLDEPKHMLLISCWLVMKWQDDLLQWDREKYGGLDEFYTDTNSIWVPDISVLNSPNQVLSNKGASYCTVSSSGSVYTALNPFYYAQCTLDFTRWPYDEHTCTLILRSRVYRGPALDIMLMKANTTDLKFFKPTGNWKLVSFTSLRNTKEMYGRMYFSSIEYRLVLRRHASSFAIIVICPAIVLALTVLSVLWIQPDCMWRIVFSIICILSHCMYLQYLSGAISNNGDSVPLIVLFYRNSMIVSCVGIMWTVIARSLCTLSTSPTWLYVLTAKFNNNHYFRQFMLAADHNKDVSDPNCEDDPSFPVKDTTHQHWRSFTVFVNRVIFSASLLVYLYSMVTLLP